MPSKNYYENHKEERKKYQLSYYNKNKVKYSEYQTEYRKNNKEKLKEYYKNYVFHSKKNLLPNFCKICNVEIDRNGGRIYCASCKKEKQKEWTKSWVKQNRLKNKKPKLCKLCGIEVESKFYCLSCSTKLKEHKKEMSKIKTTKEKIQEALNTEWRLNYKKCSFNAKRWKKECNRRRKYKLRGIKEIFTLDEWTNKKESTNGICPLCCIDVGMDKITLDHIYPVSKAELGRIYTIDDIQPLCISCNSSKQDKI